MSIRASLGALLFAAACSSAYADQPVVGPMPAPAIGGPMTAIAIANAKVRAPYDVEVIRESGDTAPTFAKADRFYVQGNAGERYTIRITNPTAHRVEAVVSIDGLDVIDGEPGDLRKRGYVVPAFGETRIEGFRTSTSDVATFRFSSVNDSYAGQKGKARNVGVIAAAIFEEDVPPEQQIIVQEQQRRPYDYKDDLDTRNTGRVGPPPPMTPAPAKTADRGGYRGGVDHAKKEAPPPANTAPAGAVGGGGGYASRRAPARDDDGDSDEVGGYYEPTPAPQQKTTRPGLGTEYGESRYSAATYTKFQRNGQRPIAVAELRYNDAPGLMALGIPVTPLPDSGEIMQRETADPFPGDDNHFARPPGR
jgi:hypothetical protein